MYFLLLYDLIRKKKTKYNTDVNIRHPFFSLCFIRFGCLWWRKYENECLIDCFFILFKCHSYHLNVSSTIRCEMVMFNYKWNMTKYNIFVLFFVVLMFFIFFCQTFQCFIPCIYYQCMWLFQYLYFIFIMIILLFHPPLVWPLWPSIQGSSSTGPQLTNI